MTVSDTLLYRKSRPKGRGWGMSENAHDGVASERRRATRARLIEAAIAEIAERGFHATSIEHICERAGFTRGAFYSNFDSKEQLFAEALEAKRRALVADLHERLGAVVLPAPSGAGIDRDAIARAIDHILTSMPKEAEWYALNTEADLLALRDPEFAARTRDSASAFLDDIGALVEHTLAEYGLQLAIEPGQAIRAVFGYLSTALREAVLGGLVRDEWTPDARQMRTVSLMLVGMIEPAP